MSVAFHRRATKSYRPEISRLVGSAVVAAGVGLLAVGCSEAPQLGPRDGSGYMVKYDQSQELDYDVAWQSSVARTLLGEVMHVEAGDEYVVTTESGANVVSAITARDGMPAWEQPVGDRLERLLGIERVGNEIIVSTQSDLYILDLASGRIKSTQRYGEQNIASTMPLILGDFALYGTPDGRIVYHNLNVGLMRAAYRVGASIAMPPMLAGNSAVVIVTTTGRINLLDPVTNTRFWDAGVLDPIEARPALGDTGLFVAGTDQSVWAFRLSDGRQMWRTRFQHPLTDDPVLIDNTLYQAVPQEGFTALNATTGQIIWQNKDVPGGTVLTRHRTDLIVWDKDDAPGAYGSTFYRIDGFTGELLATVRSDWISIATSTAMDNGVIYGLSKAGRIIKLEP